MYTFGIIISDLWQSSTPLVLILSKLGTFLLWENLSSFDATFTSNIFLSKEGVPELLIIKMKLLQIDFLRVTETVRCSYNAFKKDMLNKMRSTESRGPMKNRNFSILNIHIVNLSVLSCNLRNFYILTIQTMMSVGKNQEFYVNNVYSSTFSIETTIEWPSVYQTILNDLQLTLLFLSHSFNFIFY